MAEVMLVFLVPGKPNVGIIITHWELYFADEICDTVIFDGAIDRYQTTIDHGWRKNGATTQDEYESIWGYYKNEPDPIPYHPFHTTVYNIEVEDFHTYFVGELGLWVQSASQNNSTSPEVDLV